MRWSVLAPQYDGEWTRTLSDIGMAQSTTPIWIDESTILNISRILDETLALPLVSMMLSDNVTPSINGTSIRCTEYHNLHSDLWIANTLTTRLYIIERGAPNYSRF